MRLFFPSETDPSERRVAIMPASVAKLVKLGAVVEVEAGVGRAIHVTDGDYLSAGANVVPDRRAGLASADMILRLQKPAAAEIGSLKPGCIHISYLDPFNSLELVRRLAASKTSAICMEMIPRSTIAQKMDALSSQASLAGYVAWAYKSITELTGMPE